MSPGMMTFLGAVAAVIAFLLSALPDEAPWWAGYILGAVNAGLAFFLGKTHRGTGLRAETGTASERSRPRHNWGA